MRLLVGALLGIALFYVGGAFIFADLFWLTDVLTWSQGERRNAFGLILLSLLGCSLMAGTWTS